MTPESGAKKWLFLGAGALCLVLVLAIAMSFRGAPAPPVEITPSAPLEASGNEGEEEAGDEPVSEKWMVYVTGEVNFPGVYEIEPGGRIKDAVDLAGGMSPRADRGAVNLAEKLLDEAHISIPAISPAAPDGVPVPELAARPAAAARKPASSNSAARAGGTAYPGGGRGEKSKSRIDINSAGASELAALPGIGPKLSEAIVAYREAHGPFTRADDLRNVRGIGDKRFEALKDMIRAGN